MDNLLRILVGSKDLSIQLIAAAITEDGLLRRHLSSISLNVANVVCFYIIYNLKSI